MAVTVAAEITLRVELAVNFSHASEPKGFDRHCEPVAAHALEFVSAIRFPMLTDGSNIGPRQFEIVLSRERFKGLKAILDGLTSDCDGQREAFNSATCYEDLLKRLGYRLVLIKQIHVQDAFSRMGRSGGIRAVLPYYETSTQSSFPTLVNFDGTVSTTPKSAAFFDELLSQLKTEGQTA